MGVTQQMKKIWIITYKICLNNLIFFFNWILAPKIFLETRKGIPLCIGPLVPMQRG